MPSTSTQLKKLRQYLKLTQDEFAEKVNSKRNSISMIESGRNSPTFEMITEACKAFNISADYFLADEDPEKYLKQSNIYNVGNDILNDDLNRPANDDLNRFSATKSKKIDGSVQRLSEIDLLNKIQQNCRRINNLYQRLVDIRVLLAQELGREYNSSSNDVDTDLFWELSRLGDYSINGVKFFGYYYEKLDFEGRLMFFERQEAFITLLIDKFFDDFMEYKKDVIIPMSKELSKEFLKVRAQQTDNWTYKSFLK